MDLIVFRLMELPGGAARVVNWLVEPGVHVAPGDPLLIVTTGQVEAMLPATVEGELVEMLAMPGAEVIPGAELARLRLKSTARLHRRRPLRVTPLARRIAAHYGLDPTAATGSGVDGRIRGRDLLALLAQQQASMPPVAGQALLSSTIVPLALTVVEADFGAVLDYCRSRGSAYARRGVQLSVLACVAYKTVSALARHPLINGGWSEAGPVLRRRLHLAVPGEGVEAHWRLVRDAGDLTLRGLARAIQQSRGQEECEATFALVQTGGGGWLHPPPLLPGLVATLAVGEIVSSIVVYGDAIAVRPISRLALGFDARCIDLHVATAFLTDLRASLATFAVEGH